MIDSLSVPDTDSSLAIITPTAQYSFADCARLVVARPASAPAIVATPSVETILAIYTALQRREPLALLHHRAAPAELARQRAAIEEADAQGRLAGAALVLFTSGSTAAPRGVVFAREALIAAAAASATHLGWRDDDRWLLALSAAHAGGLAIIVRCLAARRPVVLLDRDRGSIDLAALLERCTLASLVPTQLAMLLDDPAWRPPASLRAVLLGGAPAPSSLLVAAAARGVPFLPTYGMTETLGQVATAPLDRAGDLTAPLRALPGVELRAGSSDAPAPISVRTPALATHYLDGAPIAPCLITADLGVLDGDALRVVGRSDDVIITGGENLHPAPIEAVLLATPGVRAACVVGIDDARWGQIVGAVISVAPGFDRAAAQRGWHAGLAPHARPRRLVIVDALPLLPTGKLDRRAASRALAEGADLVYGP